MKTMIVKMIMSVVLILGINFSTQAQQYACSSSSAGVSYLVTASSGLSMRAEPDLRAVKVKAVPFGKEVVVCPEFNGPEEQIEGVNGKWLRTFYRGEEGYMFSGFMKEQAEIKVVLNDAWLDEGQEEKYLGLYLSEPGDGFTEEQFEVRELSFTKDTILIEGEEPYIYSILDPSATPVFMYTGIDTPISKNIKGKHFKSKFLYPGESISLTLDDGHYHVYAKGRVLENKTGEDINPIAKIKNYELHVRKSAHDGSRIDKTIYKMDIDSWYLEGLEGGVFIHWIGDLDNDGKLDILLSKSEHSDCWDIIFHLSSKAEYGHLFKQVARYRECPGC